jgi:hypothetical protein
MYFVYSWPALKQIESQCWHRPMRLVLHFNFCVGPNVTTQTRRHWAHPDHNFHLTWWQTTFELAPRPKASLPVTAHRTPFHKQFNLRGKGPLKTWICKTFIRPLLIRKNKWDIPSTRLKCQHSESPNQVDTKTHEINSRSAIRFMKLIVAQRVKKVCAFYAM